MAVQAVQGFPKSENPTSRVPDLPSIIGGLLWTRSQSCQHEFLIGPKSGAVNATFCGPVILTNRCQALQVVAMPASLFLARLDRNMFDTMLMPMIPSVLLTIEHTKDTLHWRS